MNGFAKIVQWFKDVAPLVRGWLGWMADWISIPFMLLALFNVFSQRLLFAALAYAALWALVYSQSRQIAKLKKTTKKFDIAVYDSFADLLKQGEAMMKKISRQRNTIADKK